MQTFAKGLPYKLDRLLKTDISIRRLRELSWRNILEEIRNQGVDTLILGCTHTPLIEKGHIREYKGDDVTTFTNPGAEVAKYLKKPKRKPLHDGKCG